MAVSGKVSDCEYHITVDDVGSETDETRKRIIRWMSWIFPGEPYPDESREPEYRTLPVNDVEDAPQSDAGELPTLANVQTTRDEIQFHQERPTLPSLLAKVLGSAVCNYGTRISLHYH